MGVLDFVEKLQKKPESFRKKIAVMAAVAITAAVIFVWLAGLNFYSKQAKEEETLSGPNPFSVLAQNFKEFFSLIKNVKNVGQ